MNRQKKMNPRRRMLLATSIIHALNHITLYAFPSVVIFIREDISMNYGEIGLIAAIPTLLMVAGTPFSGRTPLGKESYVMLTGLVIMGLATVLMGTAGSKSGLIIASICLGCGGAAYHPPGFAMVSHFYEEKKGEALSINQGAGTVATGLAPFLLVASSNFIGWRETLYVCGAICVIIVPLCSILLIGVGKALIDINSSRMNNGLPKTNSLSNKSQSLLLAVFSIPLLITLVLAACRSTVFRTVTFFTVTLMNDFYGLTKSEAGFISSVILLLGAISAFFGGRLSDRLEDGRIRILLISGFGMIIFSFLLAIAGENVEEWVGIAIYLCFVCTYFFAASNFAALLAEMVPPEYRTVAYGLNFSLGQFAGALAPIIFGFLLDNYGITAGMLYMLVVSLLAVVVILLLNQIIPKTESGVEKPVTG